MVKLFFTNLFFVLLTGAMFAQSPDTVLVPAKDLEGNPIVNSIITYIVGDTNSAGEQLHTFYKLERGEWYLLDVPANFYNPVKIIADPPMTDVPPAKILPNYLPENLETATQDLLEAYADITLENIWLTGTPYSGGTRRSWGAGQALSANDTGITVTLKNVWVDYNGWSVFSTAVPNTKWYVDGLYSRNNHNPGDQWTTFLFYLETSGSVDTFVAKNCTYFQANSFFIFPPAIINYVEVDHCTFVNTLKWPFHRTEWLTAKFTNNIFYNTGALGLTNGQLPGQDPDGLMYGLINVDTLFSNTQDSVPDFFPEDERVIEVKNNLYWWSEGVEQYQAAHDTVSAAIWMNSRTIAMFANDTEWPGLVEENNWNEDPLFTEFPDLSQPVDILVQALGDIQASNTHDWDWDTDMESDPEFYRLLHPFPLPEDFTSAAGKVGTDGLPIGDLRFAGAVAVDDPFVGNPGTYALGQNYPNPFNPATTIEFTLAESGRFTLKVYNIIGQEVASLLNKEMNAGKHQVKFDAGNLSSGLYIYKLSGNNVSLIRKMMLLK